MSSVKKFARRLDAVEKGLLAAQVQPRLPYSSIDGGALRITDPATSQVQATVGLQWDGTITSTSQGGSTPIPPTVPLVTPKPGGLALYWDGTYLDDSPTRMDFKRITFHAVTNVEDLDVLNPSQIVGEITIATGGEVFAALPPVEHFVFATTWTDAGKFSVESEVAFGTPLNIVDQAQFDDINDQVDSINTEIVGLPQIYRQTTEPSVEAGKKAVWFDTDDGNAPHYFDGTSWSAMQYGSGALATNAVIASTIAAGALDAKTITGPLIQTVSTAARGIKLVGNALVTYDAAGAGTFALDGATGGVSMVGALLSGGSITGPTLQTSAVAARGIKFVGNVMTAYDGSGVAKAVINGNTGDVTISGGLISGGEVSGATVTGGMFRTAATGKRFEVDSSNPDASQIRFFTAFAEEFSPASIIAGGTRTDANNVGAGMYHSTGSLTGAGNGTSSLMLRGGRGNVPGGGGPEAATRVKLSASGSASIPASVTVNAGSAGLDAEAPVSPGISTAKLTGGQVNLESVLSPITLYVGNTIASPLVKKVIFETTGNVTLEAGAKIKTGTANVVNADAAWTSLTLTSPWAPWSAGEAPVARILNGKVECEGAIKTTGASNTLIVQMPLAMRRGGARTYRIPVMVGSAAFQLDIDPAGNISFPAGAGAGAATFVSFCFSYPILG